MKSGQKRLAPPIISIVRREGVILGNEDARICWPFDLTEKLTSESDGQSLCSPTLEGMSAILRNLGCATHPSRDETDASSVIEDVVPGIVEVPRPVLPGLNRLAVSNLILRNLVGSFARVAFAFA